MFPFPTRPKPQQRQDEPPPPKTPEDRRRVLAAIAAEEARASDHLTRLASHVAEATEREARARELLAGASAHRAESEAERFAMSASVERRLCLLRAELAAGTPPEIEALQRDIAALVEYARTKVETRLGDGFQDVSGRRPTLVSTNADAVAEFFLAARQVTAELEGLRYAEVPDLERLGPFAELTIPNVQFERARRHDEHGTFVARSVILPAALADRYAAIGGVASPTQVLSPAQTRETAWAAERSAERRWNSGEAWR